MGVRAIEEDLAETQEEVDQKVATLPAAEVAAMDTNKDGRISLEEWNAAITKATAGAVALLRTVGQRDRVRSLAARRVLGKPRSFRRQASSFRRKSYRSASRPRVLRASRVYRRRRY